MGTKRIRMMHAAKNRDTTNTRDAKAPNDRDIANHQQDKVINYQPPSKQNSQQNMRICVQWNAVTPTPMRRPGSTRRMRAFRGVMVASKDRDVSIERNNQ